VGKKFQATLKVEFWFANEDYTVGLSKIKLAPERMEG